VTDTLTPKQALSALSALDNAMAVLCDGWDYSRYSRRTDGLAGAPTALPTGRAWSPTSGRAGRSMDACRLSGTRLFAALGVPYDAPVYERDQIRCSFDAQVTGESARISLVGMSDDPNRMPFGGHASCSSQDVVAASILEDESR